MKHKTRKASTRTTNGLRKTVLKHLAEDTEEFKEQLADDKKLKKKLLAKKKRKK